MTLVLGTQSVWIIDDTGWQIEMPPGAIQVVSRIEHGEKPSCILAAGEVREVGLVRIMHTEENVSRPPSAQRVIVSIEGELSEEIREVLQAHSQNGARTFTAQGSFTLTVEGRSVLMAARDLATTNARLDNFREALERVGAAAGPAAETMGRLAMGGIVEGLALAREEVEAAPSGSKTRAPFLEL